MDEIQLDEEANLVTQYIKIRYNSQLIPKDDMNSSNSKFTSFPVYHLLLDTVLKKSGSLIIKNYYGKKNNQGNKSSEPLIEIHLSNGKTNYKVAKKIIENHKEIDRDLIDRLRLSLYRCGLLISPSWKEVAKKLSIFDDVIIGLDTNILFDGALTEQILNSLFLVEEKTYRHTPNWLLFVIPSAVMHEVEQTANKRSEGYLTKTGIIGFRGIQEILKLDKSRDLRGVSLSIAGASNPVMENRSEIHKLREDLAEFVDKLASHNNTPSGRKDPYSKETSLHHHLQWASGDMIIRDQFKEFIREIDFHKGIYFITSDKSNAALARTEGLNAIYYKKPLMSQLKEEINPTFSLKNEVIHNTVPLGNIIYEMAIGFKDIEIEWNTSKRKERILVRCDAIGESLEPWVNKDLLIGEYDLKKLLSIHQQHGKINLKKIDKKWEKLLNCIM